MEKILNNNDLKIEIEDFKTHHNQIIQAYKISQNPRLKTQILTLIPEKYSRNSIIEIFEISLYQYNLAMKQKQLKGVGQLEEKKTINRDKLNHNSVEIFLNFIMGDGYMQDVASGDTLMKFANGETYCIPLTIRLACHSKIINDYRLMCQHISIRSKKTNCLILCLEQSRSRFVY
jgi:hypothetical protein